MPTRERRLKREATDSFKARGHTPSMWLSFDNDTKFIRYCTNCQLQVCVVLNPAPNDIEISGAAVAGNCDEVIKRAEVRVRR